MYNFYPSIEVQVQIPRASNILGVWWDTANVMGKLIVECDPNVGMSQTAKLHCVREYDSVPDAARYLGHLPVGPYDTVFVFQGAAW